MCIRDSAIIEEKSSKLVETLMVSIRSEAMIMGKILAVISFVAIMVIAIVLAFAPVSYTHLYVYKRQGVRHTENLPARDSLENARNLSAVESL